MNTQFDYDILVIGGGLVGASFACALRHQHLRIGIIEAVPLGAQNQPSYDDRSLALAYGTKTIFTGMGLWDAIASQVVPIKNIHVSDKGHFGATRLNAEQYGFEALGYVVENRVLGQAFLELIPSLSNVDLICPARLTGLEIDADKASVSIDLNNGETDTGTKTLTAALIIGADGGRSVVRELTGIKTTTWDYQQSAIIANVTPDRPHQYVAYERFTEHGPIALLPMTDNRCSLVWTVAKDRVDSVLAMDDQEFIHSLQTLIGYRLGRIKKVGKRNSYPLSLVRAREHVRPRLALIGNAAHTLHPIAGQGFNLGLGDVAALSQVLVEADKTAADIGTESVLKQYKLWRRRDQLRVTAFTDGLVRLFSNSYLPLVVARNLGLLAIDLLPPLKRGMMRRTMGLSGKLPKLARGLSLDG